MDRRMRIVLADDEEFLRTCTADLLDDFGFDVVGQAEDGRQLVEQTLTAHPDIVVTDIKMPHLNGVEAAHEILRHTDVPFVFITGYRLQDYPAPDRCTHTYLTKPVDFYTLRSEIEKTFARFRQKNT